MTSVSEGTPLREAVARALDEEHRCARGGWMNHPEPGFSVVCACGAIFEDSTCPYPDSARADNVNQEHELHRADAVLAVVSSHLESRWDEMVEAGADALGNVTDDFADNTATLVLRAALAVGFDSGDAPRA